MSEVSIDKVMADISSFRQRLAMLREELGRANRSMADKMSQLGETLTQRVRDLRDQVTTAPQNLLALESRFMSGDMLFFSSRRRHTRLQGDWSSDVCSSD